LKNLVLRLYLFLDIPVDFLMNGIFRLLFLRFQLFFVFRFGILDQLMKQGDIDLPQAVNRGHYHQEQYDVFDRTHFRVFLFLTILSTMATSISIYPWNGFADLKKPFSLAKYMDLYMP